MINILLVDDNYSYSKSLINAIAEKNTEIRIFKFFTDGKESLDTILNQSDKVDIILLDLHLPKCSGADILRKISEKRINKYRKSVILISCESNVSNEFINNPYVYTFASKLNSVEMIISKINELAEVKQINSLSIETMILNELQTLSFNFSYVGTQYIYETILMICTSYEFQRIKLEKQVYTHLAEKYNTSVHTVKNNIINSTNEMYYDCPREVLFRNLGFTDTKRPTPKDIIFLIVSNIRRQCIYF